MNISMFSPGVVPPLHYGGTERVIKWLIRELAFMGHRVYFFGPHGSHVPFAEKTFLLDFPAGNINKNPMDFRDMIPGDTDMVHIHSVSNLDYGFPALKTVHGYPFYDGKILAEREQFGADYSFVSNAHRHACRRPENPYVYNGIDLDEYVYMDNKDDYFLFMGKVDWGVKGLSLALKIAMEMKLKLIIAGDFMKPSFYNTLKGFLNEDIQYIGPVSGGEKALLLAKARGLLFPILWPEPFGLVVVEALASGTPVITNYEGAMPEIMAQGETGFLCRTIGEMKECINNIGRIAPRKCREHVEKNFTSRRMAEDYLKLYQRIAAHQIRG